MFSSDERFNEKTTPGLHFSYYATNRWLTDQEVKELSAYKMAYSQVSRVIPPNKFSRLLVIACIILSSVALLWIVRLGRLKRE
jgi:hypothetical protein